MNKNNGANELMDELLEEQEKYENSLKEKMQDNLLFFDIETGGGLNNEDVNNVRRAKIRQKILDEVYTPRDDWGDSANEKHRNLFNERKEGRIAKEINDLYKMDALNPYYNRVVVLCYKTEGKITQITELELNEKEMVEHFFNNIYGKTLVGFNSKAFDLKTLQVKAAKYGIPVPKNIKHIDVFDKLKVWGIGKQPVIIGQKELGAVLGCLRGDDLSEVNPATIGDVFLAAKSGLPQELKEQIEKILLYNRQDVEQLEDIFYKLSLAGLV